MISRLLAFAGLTRRPSSLAPAMPVAPKARRQVRVDLPDNGATLVPGTVVSHDEMRRAKLAFKGIHQAEEPWPLSTAVRWMAYEWLPERDRLGVDRQAFSTRSKPGVVARTSLGPERLSYLRMLRLLRLPLPTLSKNLEGIEPHETAFRQRLDVNVIEDVKTWRLGLAIHDKQLADAEIDMRAPPEPITIPDDVERAIAAQVAEELRRVGRGARGQGSGGSGGGTTPTDIAAVPPTDEPTPPAGPKRK